MYHFLSGYTAKVAGTEIGVTEPQATFSTCFGAPFMPRHPSVYGNLLKERIAKGEVDCWLVNTGWTGGKYGVGKRMPIKETRALLNAALDGSLKNVEFRKDPNFGFEVPVSVPGVDSRSSIRAAPGRTRRNMTRWRRSSLTCSSRISRNSRTQVDEGVRQAAPEARATTSAKPNPSHRCLSARSPIGPPKDPINDRLPPTTVHYDAEIEHIGEGLLARTLPRGGMDPRSTSRRDHLPAAEAARRRSRQRAARIIRRYNESVGGVNSDTEGYHETITRVFLARRAAVPSEADRRSRCTNWSTSCCCPRWAGATGRCASIRRSGCFRSTPGGISSPGCCGVALSAHLASVDRRAEGGSIKNLFEIGGRSDDRSLGLVARHRRGSAGRHRCSDLGRRAAEGALRRLCRLGRRRNLAFSKMLAAKPTQANYPPKVDAATQERRAAHLRDLLARLNAIPEGQLSSEEKVNAAIFRTLLENAVSAAHFRTWEMPFQ